MASLHPDRQLHGVLNSLLAGVLGPWQASRGFASAFGSPLGLCKAASEHGLTAEGHGGLLGALVAGLVGHGDGGLEGSRAGCSGSMGGCCRSMGGCCGSMGGCCGSMGGCGLVAPVLAEHGLPGCSTLGQLLQGSLLDGRSIGLVPLLRRQLWVGGWASQCAQASSGSGQPRGPALRLAKSRRPVNTAVYSSMWTCSVGGRHCLQPLGRRTLMLAGWTR